MGNFIQMIIQLLQALTGGKKEPETVEEPSFISDVPDEPNFVDAVPDPDGHEHGQDCMVVNIELPASQSAESVAMVSTQAAVETAFAAEADTPPTQPALLRRVAGCNAQIHAYLNNVSIRIGPGLNFLPLATTRGGLVFPVVGATSRDSDGYRWINIKVGPRTGWIRNDLVTLTQQCTGFSFFDDDDIKPTPALPPTEKFDAPVTGVISQGYHSSHRALDVVVDEGTPIRAATDGVVIRLVRCTSCGEYGRENFYPCPDWLFRSEAWGFGYGNFLIVRHQYNAVPPEVREAMDNNDLTNAFAYVLYAHLSQLNAALGQIVQQGQLLGATGNTGCSSAAHLHFELKIGNDELIDDHWQDQIALHPNLMFDI